MARFVWIGAIVLMALGAGLFYRSRIRSPLRGRNPAPAPEYVDSKQCQGCHENVWQTYRQTGMARSFSKPVPQNTTGHNVKFYHSASASYFEMLERDGAFYQRRYQIGFDGKETNQFEKKVDYVMGSGNHVRTYLSRTRSGTIVELPLAWYAEKGGYWAMNPGYDRPDHQGFRRLITYDCMFCHNGYPDIPPSHQGAGSEPVYQGRMPEGIDCQRCHGPGGKHVRAAAAPGAGKEEIRAAIVNPARLNIERQSEVCMQCHLDTTSRRLPNSIVRYDRGPFSYRAGEPLSEFALHFDRSPGNRNDDRFEIASAAYRLRLSACFRMSRGALGCKNCHDPHDIQHSREAAQRYSRACRECHAAAFDRLVATAKHPRSDQCTGCHMPQRRTEDVVHAVMTDHYIQRRKPARDLLAGLPEFHETDATAYQGEVDLYYPAALPRPADELYLAVAQVSQSSNLTAGIPRLTAAIDRFRPNRAEFYLQLGDALRNAARFEEAIPAYEAARRIDPDSIQALEKLALSLRAAKQPARAIEILKLALAAAPDQPEVWHQLGLLYVEQGQRTDAIAALEKGAALDPDSPESNNSLGAVRLESGDLTQAEAALRTALRIQPDLAEAHSNLGNLLSSVGRLEEACFEFEAALRSKPDYATARYNYAATLARMKNYDAAQRQAEAALRADPSLAEAHELLGNLLAAEGRLDAALPQYREAIRIRPDFGRALVDLGAALADRGDISGSLPYLRRAAQSADPSIRDEAARLLMQAGARR